jgi:hypothetical protein
MSRVTSPVDFAPCTLLSCCPAPVCAAIVLLPLVLYITVGCEPMNMVILGAECSGYPGHVLALQAGTPRMIVREQVLAAARSFFRPEFLNRLDDIIVFDPLGDVSHSHQAQGRGGSWGCCCYAWSLYLQKS